MNKKLLVLLLSIVPLLLVRGVSAAPNSASLKFYPYEGQLEIGTEYAIEIRVFTEGNDTDATDVDFSFTPSMGTFRDGESTKAGVNLEEGTAYTSFIANTIGSSSGTITAYRTDAPLNTGETGYSILGTLYFTPSTTGTFSITYAFTQDLTTDSNVVQSVTSNDILTSVRNATFTIVQSGGITATPTPTGSLTPNPTSSSATGTSSSDSSTSDPSQTQQQQAEIAQEDLPIGVGEDDEPIIVEKEAEIALPFFWEEQDRVLEASRLTLVGSIMSYALMYGFKDFLFLLYRFFVGTLRLLRIYHNPRRWGIVYDSHTKLPVANVLLKLIHNDTQHVQYAVSDVDGRFGFIIDEGLYRIECNKRGYQFPSKDLDGHHDDHQYHELYFGKEFELHSQEVVTMDIPLDPIEKVHRGNHVIHYIITQYVRTHAMKILYGLSLLISAYIAIMTRSPLDIVLFFLLLLFVFDSVFVRGSLKRGVVISQTTGKRLPGVKVTLLQQNRSKYLFYTNENGEYFLVCQNGRYGITIESHGHVRHKSRITVTRGYLNSDMEI